MKKIIDFLNDNLTSNEDMAKQFHGEHFLFAGVASFLSIVGDYGVIYLILENKTHEVDWQLFMLIGAWNIITILWCYLCVLPLKQRWGIVRVFREQNPTAKDVLQFVWKYIRHPAVRKDQSYMMKRPFMQALCIFFVGAGLFNIFVTDVALYNKVVTSFIVLGIIYKFRIWFL